MRRSVYPVPSGPQARFLAATLALIACTASPVAGSHAAPAARVVVETAAGGSHAVQVELARTPAEQEQGLMFREALAEDAGMLFVFPGSERHTFWMKNTLIPLDMIFVDEGGRVVGLVERAEPRTLTAREVEAPSRYVLEVNGGWAARHGVRPGDRIRFEGVF